MMKPTILAACAALALAACAKNPDSIAPVSLGNAYQALDCATAANELRTSIANLENLSATQRAAVAGDAVAATSCGTLPAGTGVVSASATAALLPETLTLVPTDWTATDVTPQRSVTSAREHTGRWTFAVGAGRGAAPGVPS